jgi:hypothetical protein
MFFFKRKNVRKKDDAMTSKNMLLALTMLLIAQGALGFNCAGRGCAASSKTTHGT